MHHLNPKKVGLAVGGFAAAVHLVWSIIIALGWGQALADFVAWAHMVGPAPLVEPFNLGTAVLLVIVAGILGCAIGFVFATIWNKVHK
jgi:hypothetical protein